MSRPTMGSEAEPGGDADHPGHHGEAGDAVDAGVVAVGLQRRRPDPVAAADAVDRDPFVADEPD